MSSYLSVGPTGPATGGGTTEDFLVAISEIISTDFYSRSPIYETSTTAQIVIFSRILGIEAQELETFDEEVVLIAASILSDTDIIGGTPYSIYGTSIADGGGPSSTYGPSDFIDGGTAV